MVITVIEIKEVSFSYNKGRANQVQALRGISLNIKDSDLIAILGKSGAGKSSLLHLLAGIERPHSGTIYVDGVDISRLSGRALASYRNKTVGIVFQDFVLLNDDTVFENVEVPLLFGKNSRETRKRLVGEALRLVEMEELSGRAVNQLSGGQKQRVAIARAIVNNPAYILADEPTGALDTQTGEMVFDLFNKLNALGKTVVIVTHDSDIACRCKSTITISDGKLV